MSKSHQHTEEQRARTTLFAMNMKRRAIWLINNNKDKSSNDIDFVSIYFCSPSAICGRKIDNDYIRNDDKLCPHFRKKYVKDIKIDDKAYNDCLKLLWLQKFDNAKFKLIPCPLLMAIFKEIGNEVLRSGQIMAAYSLYMLGACGDSYDNHGDCVKTEEHNILCAQLFNNMSYVHLRLKDYIQAKDYAEAALQLRPDYTKCIKRLSYIIRILNVCGIPYEKGDVLIIDNKK